MQTWVNRIYISNIETIIKSYVSNLWIIFTSRIASLELLVLYDINLCKPYDIVNNFAPHFKLIFPTYSTDIFNYLDVDKNMLHMDVNYHCN